MAKIADLKNNLSRHLALVRRGREIVVYDRDTPIARIVPFVPGGKVANRRGDGQAAASAERVANLVREGILAPGDPDGLAAWLDDHPVVSTPGGSPGAVEMLLTMRRQSTR